RQPAPSSDSRALPRPARNLAAAVAAVHARGHVIGDLNESNVLASETALVTLVDTDSFQVRDPLTGAIHRCPVGKPEFTPPELQGKAFRQLDRTPEHDAFGLAVLIFQLLMEGAHPFAGIVPGCGDPPPLAERIGAGRFPHRPPRFGLFSLGRRPGGAHRPNPLAPPFELLHPELQRLFVRCFVAGHRRPRARPKAQEWQRALEAAEQALLACAANAQHRSGRHLRACPWCERAAQLGGRDPFPPRRTAPAATSQPSPAASRRPPRRTDAPTAPEPALPRFIRQPGPGLVAVMALLAGAAFRGWCSLAASPAVALNACGWSGKSVLAQ